MNVTCLDMNSVESNNKEHDLRFDWHSLLSHDEQLIMRHYSTKTFIDADEYVCGIFVTLVVYAVTGWE